MQSWKRIRLSHVIVSLGWLLAFPGCGAQSNGSGMGSETNWLQSCDSDSDCNAGSCLCGICSVACSKDSQCGKVGTNAECVSVKGLDACQARKTTRLCGPSDVASMIMSPSESESASQDGGSEVSSEQSDAAPRAHAVLDSTVDGGGGQSSGAPDETRPDPTQPNEVDTNPAASSTAPQSQSATPTKADILFVVDNSRGMLDKQRIFAESAPGFVRQIYNPDCVSETGESSPADPGADCPEGTARRQAPITDIHVGVITTSLGGYGAEFDCQDMGGPGQEQNVDMAYLLASLPRGATAAPAAAGTGFFVWNANTDEDAQGTQLSSLIVSAGEYGCGWEAPLEAWYRFLVEPFPYTKITRLPCTTDDTANSCAGPERDEGTSNQLVDLNILSQRKAFLRPDSLVAIVTMGDENDCSFRANGQAWRLAQTQATTDGAEAAYYPAFKASSACSDQAYGPNDVCCQSCGAAEVASDCPTAMTADGQTVAAGCENSPMFTLEDLDDHPNLRCFDQKRRFGVDDLYPVGRYSAALTLQQICPYSETLEAGYCDDLGLSTVTNPLLVATEQDTGGPDVAAAIERPANWIVYGSLVGVPWQDLAVSTDVDDPLEYSAASGDETPSTIEWGWLVGDSTDEAAQDPYMIESIEPRSGNNPATGEAIAKLTADKPVSTINGHEWATIDRSSLQYACTFRLPESRACPAVDEADVERQQGMLVTDCTCTDFGDASWQNPECQAEDGSYGNVQFSAGAFPATRQLSVARDVKELAVVGSICPKTLDPEAVDSGDLPFFNAMLRRIAHISNN
ncbi:MAG TPA: hypothetical protein VHM70_13315 [Polyangiaceae bacterium]|nr:hypothetical protein [Polyangiaceae bacterium]